MLYLDLYLYLYVCVCVLRNLVASYHLIIMACENLHPSGRHMTQMVGRLCHNVIIFSLFVAGATNLFILIELLSMSVFFRFICSVWSKYLAFCLLFFNPDCACTVDSMLRCVLFLNQRGQFCFG